MLTSPIHRTPTIIACIPLIAGIKLSQIYNFNSDYLILALAVVAASILLLQFIKTKRRSYTNGVHLALIILGFLILGYLRHQQVNHTNNFEGPIKSEFSATVLATPMDKAKSYRVDLLIDSAYSDSAAYHINTKVISYIEKSPQALKLIPGQRIQFHSLLNPPSGIMNPEDFDYKSYLQSKSIFATTYIPTDAWQLREDEHFTIKIRAARVQNHVLEILKSLDYEKEEMAVLSALTIGYKQMISEDQRLAYVASGSTHVLAVSGLHVGIIFLFLTRIFKIFGKSRKVVILRLFIIISLLWCFAFITGLSPSVTRATLMFSLVSIGTAGRQTSSVFNTVYLSAIIILLINPQLIFDIGFQLSYCAVLGIIAFQPYLANIFNQKLHIPKFFADLIAVSIAAQIGTAPISIHTFNCFPNYFILTNIWIIPLVGLIVNVAIILIIIALVGWPIGWIAWPLNWLLKGMNKGVDLISQIPHSLTSHLYIDTPTMVLLYAAIILFVFALDYHSKRYLFTTMFILIGTLGLNIYKIEKHKEINQLIVFSDRSSFNICAQQGGRSNLLTEQDNTLAMPSYFTQHYLSRMNTSTNKLTTNYHDYNLNYYHDFIITPEHLHSIYSEELSAYSGNINVTSLILNKEEPASIYTLYEHINFKTLVIYQRPQKHVNYYRNFCTKNGIDLHLVYEDGAYLSDF